jgi:hypothetical protein
MQKIEIDFGVLRSCLQQRGADTEAVIDWFDSSVDEQDTMRRANGCYVALAEILDRCFTDEMEANADSLEHARDMQEPA